MECSGYAQRRSDARKKRYDMMYRGLGNCLESVLKRNLWTQRFFELISVASNRSWWRRCCNLAFPKFQVLLLLWIRWCRYFHFSEYFSLYIEEVESRSLRNQSVQRTSERQFIPLTVIIQCLPAPHTTPSPSPSLSLRVDLCYFCKEMSYDEVCKQVTLTLLKS